MKHLIAIVCLIATVHAAPVAVNWEDNLPFDHSSSRKSDDFTTLAGRAALASTTGFDFPYSVHSAFAMMDDSEHFKIALRTDLSTSGSPFYERTGVLVSFCNDGQMLSLQQYVSGSECYLLAVMPFAFVTGQFYSFSVFDTGYSVSLVLDGHTMFDIDTTFSTGNRIAFYGREFDNTSTMLGAVTVMDDPILRARGESIPQSVPDSGSVMLLLSPLGLLACLRRR